ncbi:hypothetical protein GE061_014950 [Apolygus lucorum]|uniref:Uncharacterized protein n=1 Tax=Apolygus lucorum TaxID=248454 RepID=A0A8S9XNP6_APOLU|nr:hypothetical protein GE061_014950 [Apolygus lucorum]
MATTEDEKGPSLKKRLDRLEGELKRLHDKIIQRRLKKLQSSYTSNESITLESNKPYLPRDRGRNPIDDGKDWYKCLKSITQSIAQGSDAIRRIASLTDITSMNETFSSIMQYTTDQESCGPKAIGRPGQTDRDLLAYHVNTGWPARTTSDNSAFEKTNVSKSLTMSRSDGGISNIQSKNPQMHVFQHKKLKEETKKRQIAERKVTDALKPTNADDSKAKSSSNKPNITTSTREKGQEIETNALDDKEEPSQTISGDTEELPMESRRSLIEKKYVEEREKRIELEGIVSQFREDLKSKTKECAQISVGQKMALALAEQFRAKYEKGSRNSSDDESYLMKALKDSNKECLKLQDELSRLNKTQEQNMANAYKERALKAEVELQSLQKHLEQYSKLNPLDSKIVQTVLEKHKQAYSELLLAKKCSDAEYKARCRRLEGEVARLHAYYEKRVSTLNDRIKELLLQLQEKIICIDSFTNSRDNCDVNTLKKTVSEMNVEARQRDAEIGALNAIIADKDNYAKLIETQKEEAMEKLNDLQKAVGELQSSLDTKNAEIGRLLEKVQKKSDEIAIKEKLLIDHSETVTELRKTLSEHKKTNDQSREELFSQLMTLKQENARLLENVSEMTLTIMESEKFKEGQEKNMFLLQQLEAQVYDRQNEWEQQLCTMSKEKDQAIQTAK